jgi:hypothetical protein
MRKRQLLIPLGIAAGLAVVPGVAAAAWQVSGSNSGTAAVSSVGTGAQPTLVSVATSTVNLKWAPSTVASGVEASSYTVSYYAAATGGTAQGSQTCSGPSSAGFVNCAITSVSAGTHFFGVTPKYRNWTGVEGTRTSATATSPGTATKLRFAQCTTGSISNFGKNVTFTSTVQMLNASNALVADNPSAVTVDLSSTGAGSDNVWNPTSLTVPANSSATSSAASITSTSANNNNSFTITAHSRTAGIADATCTITK